MKSKVYSFENWQDALPYIDKPGKFWNKNNPDDKYQGILRELEILYDIGGGTMYFYADDEDFEPIGNFEFFEPDVQDTDEN